MNGDLYITGDPDADRLINSDATGLLIGMLLDQQISMELAFIGPSRLLERLGHLDPQRVSAMGVESFVESCCIRPAIHRFPAAMGKRIHTLCEALTTQYAADPERIWLEASDAADLRSRLRALPGFGDEKTMIFIALLAKRFGVQLPGWKDAAGVFADEVPRSIADSSDSRALAEIRAWKQNQRGALLDKQGRPLRTSRTSADVRSSTFDAASGES